MWEYKDYHQLCFHSYSTKQWASGLNRASAAVPLLWLLVRIPPGARNSICWEFCVLSGRGLCFGLITRPEEFYRMWGVWVWSWKLDNEEDLAGKELSSKENKYLVNILYLLFLKDGPTTSSQESYSMWHWVGSNATDKSYIQ